MLPHHLEQCHLTGVFVCPLLADVAVCALLKISIYYRTVWATSHDCVTWLCKPQLNVNLAQANDPQPTQKPTFIRRLRTTNNQRRPVSASATLAECSRTTRASCTCRATPGAILAVFRVLAEPDNIHVIRRKWFQSTRPVVRFESQAIDFADLEHLWPKFVVKVERGGGLLGSGDAGSIPAVRVAFCRFRRMFSEVRAVWMIPSENNRQFWKNL